MRWIWSPRTRSCATNRGMNPAESELLQGPCFRIGSRMRLHSSGLNPGDLMCRFSSGRRNGLAAIAARFPWTEAGFDRSASNGHPEESRGETNQRRTRISQIVLSACDAFRRLSGRARGKVEGAQYLREESLDAPSGTLAERRLGLAVGGLLSLPIGVLSGFTGVGGGEYRAPVLLTLLGRVRWVIAANLLVGLFVAVFNVVFRQAWTLNLDFLLIALLLVPTSLPGAWVGAVITNRISTSVLKGLLAGILVATGLRLILFEVQLGGAFSFDPLRIALALALGFGLRLISGLLGVAGGEYRIPALILLFGVPTVFAGTLSSLASIPVQFIGLLKHRNLGHTGDRKSTRLNSSHSQISYAVFCLKKKTPYTYDQPTPLIHAPARPLLLRGPQTETALTYANASPPNTVTVPTPLTSTLYIQMHQN